MSRLSVAAAVIVLLLGGYAMAPLPVPPASIRVVNKIDSTPFPAFAVGVFVTGPGLPPESDRAAGVRAGIVRPEGGSFARYLGETLKAELAAAGRLDAASDTVVSGRLVKNEVSSAIGKGHGDLAAEFVVTRHGVVTFRKVLSVRREWDSSFIGAVAIPEAETGYGGLYPALIEALFDDADFLAAVRGA